MYLIIIAEPIVWISKPGNISVEDGDRAETTIPCKASSDPLIGINVTWLVDGYEVKRDSRQFPFMSQDGMLHLDAKNLDLHKDTLFRCEVICLNKL